MEEAIQERRLSKQLEESARARSGLYRTLASLFLKELGSNGIEAIALDIRPGSMLGDADVGAGLSLMADYLATRNHGTRQELAVDYTRAILAAGNYQDCMAIPYESVFTSEDGLLMQEARDDVYRLLCESRLAVRPELHAPEDHLGFELEFMAALADRQAQALNEGDIPAALEQARIQKEIHASHLSNWMDDYCDALQSCARTGFYQGVAKLTRGFIHVERDFITDTVSALEELSHL